MADYTNSSVKLDDGSMMAVLRVERGRVYGERAWPNGRFTKFSGSVAAWENLLADAEAEKARDISGVQPGDEGSATSTA